MPTADDPPTATTGAARSSNYNNRLVRFVSSVRMLLRSYSVDKAKFPCLNSSCSSMRDGQDCKDIDEARKMHVRQVYRG